ncbi:MAG: hypothetical protein WA324_06285 [Bryobacteraceae bacterium]
MPEQRLPPMPKLPPFALSGIEPRKQQPYYLFIFFLFFTAPLLLTHWPLLSLPYFWDEQGQFIPTALDLLRDGLWVAHSTLPNVHPPGVEAYLVLWYKLFGYSIPITRVAMLMLAGIGLLVTFLLAIELSRGSNGAPALLPPILLLASPLFFMQSMMAQLDMPAMVFTVLALYLLLRKRYAYAAGASVLLVLAKESGIVVPLVMFCFLLVMGERRRAAYFVAPAAALGAWLVLLHASTGYWLGNPGFAHYNVGYAIHPVRLALSFARRFYYLFFAEFRWIGTLVLAVTIRRTPILKSANWRIAGAVSAANFILVSVLGGAELERYLLPVLPVFYIAVSIGITYLRPWTGRVAAGALLAGLIVNLFWNPPYPFPYENNFAMVDFVQLEELASHYTERFLGNKIIATAWPYSNGLTQPDFGFVRHRLVVIETNDFHEASIRALPAENFQVLITYTRTWAPQNGVIQIAAVRRFLTHFYEWAPEITTAQCIKLGLYPVMSWETHGQHATIYLREPPPGKTIPLAF